MAHENRVQWLCFIAWIVISAAGYAGAVLVFCSEDIEFEIVGMCLFGFSLSFYPHLQEITDSAT